MRMAYNGWTNYETWLCVLWFGDCFEEIAKYREPGTDSFELAAHFEAAIYQEADDANIPESGFFADLINAGIKEVDFHDIAENYLEFVPQEEEDEEEEDEDEDC